MAEFDKSKFDAKAVAEARKAEMEQMTTKLEKGVKDIFSRDKFKDYLNFCAKLPRYSVNNQILIMLQKPEATMCQSFTGWKEQNRFVKKGEKGIRILAPAPYKMQKEQEKMGADGKVILDKDGEPVRETVEVTVNAYKPVSTFDISQTDGEPVPTVGVSELTGLVEGYDGLLNAIKDVVPVPVSFEQIDSGAKGFYHLEENRIVVQEGMSEAQTIKTLLHETAHQTLHSKEAVAASGETKSKSQRETEAESVAYVVCQHYGIDTSEYSFAYVATWSEGKDVSKLKASLDTIRRTASDLIIKIDEKMQEKSAEHEQQVDQFITGQDEEFPFEQPEADLKEGFIQIEPPVDFSELKKEKKQEIAKDNAEQKPEKTTEAKPEKKSSIKAQLKAKKAKAEKLKTKKKTPDKDLQAAM